MSRAAFYFDSRSCSGCKACQIACKDKHGLEVGRLWRRVYEITGGSGWHTTGDVWQPDVQVYNLSIACNHCQDPICVDVCPSGAMYQREDGIVLIDPEICLGCKYCSMACPYGAPQYDARSGVMTKCTYCVDNLEAGQPPVCVAACPMRVLECEPHNQLFVLEHNRRSLPPLPPSGLTNPAMWIAPHAAAYRIEGNGARDAARGAVKVSNREEVGQGAHAETSLAVFTVLLPMLVGMFLSLGMAFFGLEIRVGHSAAAELVDGVFWLLAAGMGGTMLISLLHLGHPRRAVRAIANSGGSWLSREVWFAGLFTVDILLFAGLIQLSKEPYPEILYSLGTVCGLSLIYTIGRVYRIHTVPAWDSRITQLSPAMTTFALGGLASSPVYSLAAIQAAGVYPGLEILSLASAVLAWLGWSGLVAGLALSRLENHRLDNLDPGLMQWQVTARERWRGWWLRAVLVLLSGLALAGGQVVTQQGNFQMIAFGFGLAAELSGRLIFYRARPI